MADCSTSVRETAARGAFITFEGADGCGKSTQINYVARLLERHGCRVLRLREPGGTAVGEVLRGVVLDPAHTRMSDRAELLIYEAARAQIVDEVIEPALRRGDVVLCDRFFDSTVAYQAYGRGLDRAFVDAANRFAADGIVPDLTILLHARDAAARVRRRVAADRLEREGDAFRRRVEEGFSRLAHEAPERVRPVESCRDKADTLRAVLAELAGVFPWMGELLEGADGAREIAAAMSEAASQFRREKECARG